MPATSYPFIDIAVHERVRAHFARGEAAVLFSPDLARVLWSNGEGAALFSGGSIYDFLEAGPPAGDVAFRQMHAAAQALRHEGDRRGFVMRIGAGFRRVAVQAAVELILLKDGEQAVLFTAPRAGAALPPARAAERMIAGLEDPDTHMAVLDGEGAVLAASPGFAALGMTTANCRLLVKAAARDAGWRIKRPVPTGKGHLPAAIGRLSDDPPLSLLLAVETILGHLDATPDFEPPHAETDFSASSAAVSALPAMASASAQAPDPSPAVTHPAPADADQGQMPEEDQPHRNVEAGEAVDAAQPADASMPDAAQTAAPVAADAIEPAQAEGPAAPIEEAVDTPLSGEDISATQTEDVTDPVAEAAVIEPAQADAPPIVETVEIEEPSEALGEDDLDGLMKDETLNLPTTLAEARAAYVLQVAEKIRSNADQATDADPASEAPAENAAEPVSPLDADAGQSVDEADSDETGRIAPEAKTEAADEAEQTIQADAGPLAVEQPDTGHIETVDAVAAETETAAQPPAQDALDEAPASEDQPTAAQPVAEARAEEEPAEETLGFRFDPSLRTMRFVWKIDADGRFSEISPEFAQAVGPKAADVIGLRFVDLAALMDLDPQQTIANLLKRHDTWSGKTINWPIQGHDLRVPVDLAALPTYSRERQFDGFRGFGIVRLADAVADDGGIGRLIETLDTDLGALLRGSEEPEDALDHAAGPASEQADRTEDAAQPNPEAAAEDAQPAEPDLPRAAQDEAVLPQAATDDPGEAATSELCADDQAEEEAGGEEEADAEDDSAPQDPFRGERPALRIVEPASVGDERVVHLQDHRRGSFDSLSRSERAAFREIARQLGEAFGERAEDAPEPEAESSTPVESRDLSKDRAEPSHDGQVSETEPGGEPLSSEGPVLTAAIVDPQPTAILIHTGEDLLHANPALLALTGYDSLADLIGEGGLEALFVGEDEGLIDVPAGAVMMIRNDGRLLPVSARLQTVRWEDRGVVLMLALAALNPDPSKAPGPSPERLQAVSQDQPAEAAGTEAAERDAPAEAQAQATHDAQDRGEQEKGEQEIGRLRIEVDELRAILETATDGVVVLGADGEIRSLNRSANALFNYDDEEIRGKPFAMLFAHESQKSVIDYLAGLSGHGVASVLNDGREVIGREASGGFIPLFMTMGRLSFSKGYCAVIRDITQWKRTEEELRNAKRAAETANAHKSEFLARVSHEIRTPLNAIIGFSDMMATEHFGPIGNPRYVEYAGDIGRSGRYVLDIVNDLLDISKIEAGEMDLDFTAVMLNSAVAEAVALVQPQANAQRVIIRTSLSSTVPGVVADQRSIKQIVLNILTNAIRFTPSGGQIVVSSAYEANGTVTLRFRDTGVGMTRSELEQAMKPFRQVTTGTRARGDGTGLGLPLTKAMVEANRANFSISSAPNEGTLVEIAFPPQRVLAE
ncbi:PAS domain S-box protein [Rhizobium rhizosphaerae]|uniref:PAS domain S-box protein n=1 Tax=Xaviernesmea rhizosphaerae TaxID=1672749 RepID=UPI00111A3EC0|nr:PAS domain S-box protein [Xaviernesmea rhizosphaerae]